MYSSASFLTELSIDLFLMYIMGLKPHLMYSCEESCGRISTKENVMEMLTRITIVQNSDIVNVALFTEMSNQPRTREDF